VTPPAQLPATQPGRVNRPPLLIEGNFSRETRALNPL
jgi:hypothetical protein